MTSEEHENTLSDGGEFLIEGEDGIDATVDDQAARRRKQEYLAEGEEMPTTPNLKRPQGGGMGMLGPYRLVRELGRGAMGVVYEAVDTTSNKTVAVKVLPPGLAASDQAKQRFIREGEAMAALRHPNILPVYGLGEHEGTFYYSMAIVTGKSLKDVIDAEGLTAKQAAAYCRDAARALDYAHEARVIHRDIKPANLLIEPGEDGGEGKVLVADFGIAKSGEHATLTATGTIMGTPMFMSPEQAQGDTSGMDGRADVYSLGASLYECITRAKPYSGEDVQTILRHVIETEPVPPRRINPDVPKPLEAIVTKSMEKRRDRRYVTAGEMADDLDRFLKGQPVHAKARGPIGRAMKWAGKHKAAAALLFIIVVGTLGGGGMVGYLRWQRANEIRTALREANAALMEGDIATARKKYAAVEQLDPGNPAAASGDEVIKAREAELAAAQARADAAALVKEGRAKLAAGGTAGMDAAVGAARAAAARDPGSAGARALKYEAELARLQYAVERERFADARAQLSLTRDAADAAGVKDAAAVLDRLERTILGMGSFALTTTPAAAQVTLHRADPVTGHWDQGEPLGATPIATRDLPMGSYLAVITLAEYAEVRFPFEVGRSSAVAPAIPLVPERLVPDGMVHVPAGESWIGDPSHAASKKQRLPAFLAEIHEVSRERYAEFLIAQRKELEAMDQEQARTLVQEMYLDMLPQRPVGKYLWQPQDLPGLQKRDGRDMPVVAVSWTAAQAYAQWKGRRLPTGPEWERLARGADRRPYPWGTQFDTARLNTIAAKNETRLVPVHAFPEGAGPFGTLNLLGNVAEFTSTLVRTVSAPDGSQRELMGVRGGSVANEPHELKAWAVVGYKKEIRASGIGFRCVQDLPKKYGGTK
ncbi:MAG: bifunctional serine/threonine-protein kinase/formylglycine-generating enzyme family protein [Planctomycetota bacterium]|jgi:formylglycine-generating enzyme required for sulfatase activity